MFLKSHAKEVEEWTRFAQEQGLTLAQLPPDVRVEGSLEGLAVLISNDTDHELDEDDDGNTTTETTYTGLVEVTPRASLGDLAVTPRGFAARLAKLFGGHDLELGDPAFDQAFLVKCRHPQLATQLLTPAARQALLHARLQVHDLSIEEGAVRWKGRWVDGTDHALKLLQALLPVARALGS